MPRLFNRFMTSCGFDTRKFKSFCGGSKRFITALMFVLYSFLVSSSIGLPFLSVNIGVGVLICSSTLASMFGSAFRLRRVALTRNGMAFGKGISSGLLIRYFGARSGCGLEDGVLA